MIHGIQLGVRDRQLVARLLGMPKSPPEEPTYKAAHLTTTAYMMGKDPVSGKYYKDLMIENGAYWRLAWESRFGSWVVVEARPDLCPTQAAESKVVRGKICHMIQSLA